MAVGFRSFSGFTLLRTLSLQGEGRVRGLKQLFGVGCLVFGKKRWRMADDR
jgi:hypothetical protein